MARPKKVITEKKIPKKRGRKPKVKPNELMVQTTPEVQEISQNQVNEIRDQLRIHLVLQARHEVDRVIKLTETLDMLQDKYQEKVLQYVMDHDNEEAVKYLPMMIENLTKSLERSYAIINQVVGNDKIMNFQVIQNNISDSTIEIGTHGRTTTEDLTDPISRERVRRVMAEILKDINSVEI